MNNNIQLFNIAPNIPKELNFLERLSYNMWWCWHFDAIDLFRRINPTLWKKVNGNTRAFLSMIPQAELEALADNSGFIRHLKRVQYSFDRDVTKLIDKSDAHKLENRKVIYFSLEYGIHESVRLFSGGLGVLAGDHLKAASDLRVPMVAVGLLYRQGYFRQFLDHSGWQNERYPENEIHMMPVTRVVDKDNNPVTVSFKLLDKMLYAAVWKLEVGNVPLILLDTEIPENPPEFQEITWRLYGGDKRMRLHQELLLGIGGYKALIEMGIEPSVCHMNEGHAAFLNVARISHLVNDLGLEPDVAIEIAWRSNIFTTHTPVPAGNEVFDIGLLKPYLEALSDELCIGVDRFINWGVPISQRNKANELCMTILGLRMSNYSNGVSKLHGQVAREMWQHLWPTRQLDEIPITHITNGVHLASWIAERKKIIMDHYLNPDWLESPVDEGIINAVDNIPDEELWYSHEMCRQTLIRNARQCYKKQLRFRKASIQGAFKTKNILSEDVLSIGFARRFATYKRATLLLRDRDRLKALLTDTNRPVQIIFAGKAHPADDAGKSFIQQIVQFAESENLTHRLVFLEDYDIGLARTLVQGVDVWLNTPERPQEASGTSGMKAAINGVLNCSILDGWWDEAYAIHKDAGWEIASGESFDNVNDRDDVEAQVLFNLIENEIIPHFYDRSEGDIPYRWVKMMKESIKMGISEFSSRRMVSEYNEKFYKPAAESHAKLIVNNAELARKVVSEKNRYIEHLDAVKIKQPIVDNEMINVHVGDVFKVSTEVFLGELKPEEVDVEVYYGPVNAQNAIQHCNVEVMGMAKDLGNGMYKYEYDLTCIDPGRFGLTARVTPKGNSWDNSVPGFVKWAD